MFIDFLGVMLINLAAGLAILGHFLYVNPEPESRLSWGSGFFAVGLLGFVTSLVMVTTWPLPGGFNVAFGEPSLFLSTAFLAAALTLTLKWEPIIPAIYGSFGGVLSIIVGMRLMNLHLTHSPLLAGLGYITAGLGGILTLPALKWRRLRGLAILTAAILGISAFIWAVTGYEAVWGHIASFSHWMPIVPVHPSVK